MPETVAPDDARHVRPYDFQRHEAMDRSRLRRLSPVLEVAAHRATQSLTSISRAAFKVEVTDLEQKRWEAWTNELPEPTYIATATISPHGGRVAFHAPLALVHAVNELRLGGSLSGVVPARAVTDIEARLFGEVVDALLAELFAAMSVVVPMSCGPLQVYNSAVLIQVPNPSEISLLITIRVMLDEERHFEATVCLPLLVFLSLLDGLERIEMSDVTEHDSLAALVRERLLDASVDVTISFPDVVLSTDELLSVRVGDVIALHRPEGLPLRLSVEGHHYCQVVPTTQGKRLACMVIDSVIEEEK